MDWLGIQLAQSMAQVGVQPLLMDGKNQCFLIQYVKTFI